MTHCDEAAYVATLTMLYVDLPHTPLRPGPQDQSPVGFLATLAQG